MIWLGFHWLMWEQTLFITSVTAVSKSLNKITILYTRMGSRGLCHKYQFEENVRLKKLFYIDISV